MVRGPLCSVTLQSRPSRTSGLHFEHTHRFGNISSWNEAGCAVQEGLGQGIQTLSWVDGFTELSVTRQPAAACAVIQPEDKVLFNNCLNVIEVLRTLQICKENSTCLR